MFDAIGEAAPRSIGSFTGQGLANTLWAYCVLGVDAPAFFAAAAEALSQFKVEQFKHHPLRLELSLELLKLQRVVLVRAG